VRFGRSTINELNGLMRVHPMLTRLTTNGTAYSTKLWFEVREPADCLRHGTQRGDIIAAAIANAVRNVTIARFTSMTPARRGRVAGAACIMRDRLRFAAYAARQRENDKRQPRILRA